MIKTKICGMGHEGRFTFVIVEKNRHFFNWLAHLLYRSFKICDVDTYDFENRKGKWITRKKQIKNFIDKHESYYVIGAKERVDIFYGKDRVLITVNAPLRTKRKFLDIIEELSEWAKIKKATFRPPFQKTV